MNENIVSNDRQTSLHVGFRTRENSTRVDSSYVQLELTITSIQRRNFEFAHISYLYREGVERTEFSEELTYVMFAFRCMKWRKTFSPLQENRKLKSTFRRGVNFLFNKKNLLLTNSITSGAFIAIGDLVQQEYEFQAKVLLERYDWSRTVRMFLVGVMLGPLHHYYYIQLDKILPKTDLTTITKKILCDQLVVSPLTIICFFYGMGILERKTIHESTEEIKRKFTYVYMGDCFFWPPVQFINFYYLPTEYRVVYINLATMIFNIFLSYMKHFDQH